MGRKAKRNKLDRQPQAAGSESVATEKRVSRSERYHLRKEHRGAV